MTNILDMSSLSLKIIVLPLLWLCLFTPNDVFRWEIFNLFIFTFRSVLFCVLLRNLCLSRGHGNIPPYYLPEALLFYPWQLSQSSIYLKLANWFLSGVPRWVKTDLDNTLERRPSEGESPKYSCRKTMPVDTKTCSI